MENVPVEPVVLRMIPFEPPLTETLRNLTLPLPMVAFVMLTPVVVAVLVAPTVLLALVTLIVRPVPEAEKTAAVLFNVMAPLMVTVGVPPVQAMATPAPPLLPMAPENVMVLVPVRTAMSIAFCAAVFCVIVPA